MLKPLLLPKLVEERKRRESMLDTETDQIPQGYDLKDSFASDAQSPVTPTFSTRGHLRYSSSVSSIEASSYSPVTDSPSSPTFVGMKTGKRSLPDVQEEPQEREEDFDMLEDIQDVYDWSCDDKCGHRETVMAQSSVQLSTKGGFEYDLTDGFVSDGELGLRTRNKKRRAGESPFTVIATRIGTRFPTFSRKWRSRKGSNTTPPALDSPLDFSTSRAASSRSSSLSNSVYQGLAISYEAQMAQMPPTPNESQLDVRDDQGHASLDLETRDREDEEREQNFASTPLLPPLMVDASAHSIVPVQSPLQSPSVAEPTDPYLVSTPGSGIATPTMPGMPSPPLSTKPSMSSIQRVQLSRPGHLVPSSEIPPIVIADADDEWANKLGHANFTIHPEPYVPDAFDLEACRQLRANWDLARCNYTKHLVRTGEHYGVTSKTYKLTEQKWAETDGLWKRNNHLTIQNTANSGEAAFLTLKYTPLGELSEQNLMTKIPSLNDPSTEGKFPQLGDEDIVGPMTQAAAQLQRSPSKKAKLMRFFTEKFPAGFGRTMT